jgi:hypothetical protein
MTAAGDEARCGWEVFDPPELKGEGDRLHHSPCLMPPSLWGALPRRAAGDNARAAKHGTTERSGHHQASSSELPLLAG